MRETDGLREQYQKLLAEGIVPFWLRALDHEFGGVFTCMREDGEILNTDKYTWSQARFVWTLAALYNRFERRPLFLEHARKTIDFLLDKARDDQGRFVFKTTREGVHLEGATSIYSDCFVVYGIREYCRATPAAGLERVADEIQARIQRRVEEPDFAEVAPYSLPPNRRVHGIPMMLTLITGERRYVDCIMDRFVRPERRLLVEFLTRDYEELPGNEGSFVMPGHAVESMWFVMEWARVHADETMIRRAAEVLRWHLEAGWDNAYGGIFLGIDANGQAERTSGTTSFLPHSEKKIWWVHTEALYALLLAYHLTGEAWCLDWYWRVHDWAFTRFPLAPYGEWRQRLDRAGGPVSDLIALPVKDPFHLPRSVLLILDLLGTNESIPIQRRVKPRFARARKAVKQRDWAR